jgi:hypothetical protein
MKVVSARSEVLTMVNFCVAFSSTLTMKVGFSSEISVNFYQITHNNLPEHITLYSGHIQKLLTSFEHNIILNYVGDRNVAKYNEEFRA